MGFSLETALRAPFWKVLGIGTSGYTGPAIDIAGDNGNQAKVLDPNGQPMNLSVNSSSTRGRTILNNPNGVSVSGVISTASAPTVTPTGGSASTWAYKIVARASNGTAAASAAGTTTTGAATLSNTAYNTITWTAVADAVSYDVYRTTAATSPSTTGFIRNVLAGATLSVVDTGLTADGSTAPTVNTTGVMEAVSYFDIAVIGLAAVQNTAITNGGTAGVTGYSYKVSSVTATGTENATASAASTTTGNATLSATNYNTITWKPVPGAKSYNVYRSASSGTPGTTGRIANVLATSSQTSVTVNDTGLTASGSVPTTNTTGAISTSNASAQRFTSIYDSNGNPELYFPPTASAVNGLVLENSATGNSVRMTPGAATGSDTNIGLVINSKGTGALVMAPASAAGTVQVGGNTQTGNITIGTSSGAQTVRINNGAGVVTTEINNATTAGSTLELSTGAPAGSAVDAVRIATGNAVTSGSKRVLIATGTPATVGNNQVTIGGGAGSRVCINAVARSFTAVNYQGTETGANNAIACALMDAGGANITQAEGLRLTIKLAHTLQAGANTLALNGGAAANIKSGLNPANNIGTAYAVGGVIELLFDGTQYLDLRQ
jgi:hypothetical protein